MEPPASYLTGGEIGFPGVYVVVPRSPFRPSGLKHHLGIWSMWVALHSDKLKTFANIITVKQYRED